MTHRNAADANLLPIPPAHKRQRLEQQLSKAFYLNTGVESVHSEEDNDPDAILAAKRSQLVELIAPGLYTRQLSRITRYDTRPLIGIANELYSGYEDSTKQLRELNDVALKVDELTAELQAERSKVVKITKKAHRERATLTAKVKNLEEKIASLEQEYANLQRDVARLEALLGQEQQARLAVERDLGDKLKRAELDADKKLDERLKQAKLDADKALDERLKQAKLDVDKALDERLKQAKLNADKALDERLKQERLVTENQFKAFQEENARKLEAHKQMVKDMLRDFSTLVAQSEARISGEPADSM